MPDDRLDLLTIKRREDIAKLFSSLISWLNNLVEESCADPHDFLKFLSDGVVLCSLLNVIKPGIIKKINKRRKLASAMDNLTVFLSACENDFGIPKSRLFSVEDFQDFLAANENSINEYRHWKRCERIALTLFWLAKFVESDPHLPQLDYSAFSGFVPRTAIQNPFPFSPTPVARSSANSIADTRANSSTSLSLPTTPFSSGVAVVVHNSYSSSRVTMGATQPSGDHLDEQRKRNSELSASAATDPVVSSATADNQLIQREDNTPLVRINNNNSRQVEHNSLHSVPPAKSSSVVNDSSSKQQQQLPGRLQKQPEQLTDNTISIEEKETMPHLGSSGNNSRQPRQSSSIQRNNNSLDDEEEPWQSALQSWKGRRGRLMQQHSLPSVHNAPTGDLPQSDDVRRNIREMRENIRKFAREQHITPYSTELHHTIKQSVSFSSPKRAASLDPRAHFERTSSLPVYDYGVDDIEKDERQNSDVVLTDLNVSYVDPVNAQPPADIQLPNTAISTSPPQTVLRTRPPQTVLSTSPPQVPSSTIPLQANTPDPDIYKPSRRTSVTDEHSMSMTTVSNTSGSSTIVIRRSQQSSDSEASGVGDVNGLSDLVKSHRSVSIRMHLPLTGSRPKEWGWKLKGEIDSGNNATAAGPPFKVDSVVISGCADLCDVQKGDILQRVNDKDVLTDKSLTLSQLEVTLNELAKQGKPVAISVLRDRDYENFDDYSTDETDPSSSAHSLRDIDSEEEAVKPVDEAPFFSNAPPVPTGIIIERSVHVLTASTDSFHTNGTVHDKKPGDEKVEFAQPLLSKVSSRTDSHATKNKPPPHVMGHQASLSTTEPTYLNSVSHNLLERSIRQASEERMPTLGTLSSNWRTPVNYPSSQSSPEKKPSTLPPPPSQPTLDFSLTTSTKRPKSPQRNRANTYRSPTRRSSVTRAPPRSPLYGRDSTDSDEIVDENTDAFARRSVQEPHRQSTKTMPLVINSRRSCPSSTPPQNVVNVITDTPPPQPRVVRLNPRQKCTACRLELGNGELMTIEQMSLSYHLACFVCVRCRLALGDGKTTTDVLMQNQMLYCSRCYPSSGKNRGSKTMPQSPQRSGSLPDSKYSPKLRNSTCITNGNNQGI